MKQYQTFSEKETKKLAKNLAKKLKGVIALSGQLGAGKTAFVQGFAQGLGIKEKIISPTFVLIRQHKIPNIKKILYHIDLYRLDNQRQFRQLGIEEIIDNPHNLVVIEWAEKIKNLLPKYTTVISFEIIDANTRRLNLETLL